MPDFENMCFFITPIGEEGTPERKRADGVMRAMVEPAAADHNLTVERADMMGEPGIITAQIVEHVVEAKAVVADLTGENANVFYELAVRDAAQKGAVMIAEVGTDLPFDKSQDRTIFFETADLASVWDAKDKLSGFLGAALEGKMGNPISTAMVWKDFAESGKPVEEAVAQLAEQVSQIAADVHGLSRRDAIKQAVRNQYVHTPGGTLGSVVIGDGTVGVPNFDTILTNEQLEAARRAGPIRDFPEGGGVYIYPPETRDGPGGEEALEVEDDADPEAPPDPV